MSDCRENENGNLCAKTLNWDFDLKKYGKRRKNCKKCCSQGRVDVIVFWPLRQRHTFDQIIELDSHFSSTTKTLKGITLLIFANFILLMSIDRTLSETDWLRALNEFLDKRNHDFDVLCTLVLVQKLHSNTIYIYKYIG